MCVALKYLVWYIIKASCRFCNIKEKDLLERAGQRKNISPHGNAQHYLSNEVANFSLCNDSTIDLELSAGILKTMRIRHVSLILG